MSIPLHASWRVIGYLLSATLTLIAFSGHAQNTKLIIQSGSHFTATGNNIVLYNTDVKCDGAFDALNHLWVTGSKQTSFSGSGVPQIQDLTMNTSDTLKLNCLVDVTGVLQFQNGILDLNGQLLQLDGTGTLQSESETSHITGISGGRIVANATSVSNPHQLNVGVLGAVLTSSANLGNLTVSRSHRPATNPFFPKLHGIQRTFLIQPQNDKNLNATLRFNYLNAELAGGNANTLSLWKSDDGVFWRRVGFDTRSAAGKYVEKTGIHELSYWTLTDFGDPLSFMLGAIKIICKDGYPVLCWQTDVEDGLDHFEIERSLDGKVWTDLGSVGAFNNPYGSSYQYTDEHPSSGASYRLKIVGKSGMFSYSPIFPCGCQDITMPLIVYPNPATVQAVVQVGVREGVPATLQLLDRMGRVVYTTSRTLIAGINQFIVPVSGLVAGIYVVRLILPTTTLNALLIKK